jgi:hypothetical protein
LRAARIPFRRRRVGDRQRCPIGAPAHTSPPRKTEKRVLTPFQSPTAPLRDMATVGQNGTGRSGLPPF